MAKQISIPGLELPPVPAKPKPANIGRRVKLLEQRLTQLEIELTLLRIQLEGDKEHA